jgi:hypothetical protein
MTADFEKTGSFLPVFLLSKSFLEKYKKIQKNS